jgi:FtsZ-binding cell division protein ZapB
MKYTISLNSHLKSVTRAVLIGAVYGISLPHLTANANMNEVRDVYKEYITIRKVIGEEKHEWKTQQSAMTDMITVVEMEIAALRAAMETMEAKMSGADEERALLQEKLDGLRQMSNSYDQQITGYENRIKTMRDWLPENLVKDVQPLFARLPQDPAATRLSYSQRLQNVVGILAQVNNFNSDLRLFTEVQEVAGGRMEVQTLYFGLGMAIFSDVGGKFAGYGVPTESGWQWKRAEASEAVAISHAIDVHANRRAPAFVSIPMKIK